jgi:glycosyltransferase involved in cell wall biosynthesis
MSAGPSVSVIVPVFNGERHLREALDSIFGQNVPVAEVIVVDDGSTDRTPEVVTGYGRPLRYARQENAGAPAARNHGLRLAGGDYIAFLDADDLWEPEKTRQQLAEFERAPGLAYCVCHAQNFWGPELAAQMEAYRDHPKLRPMPAYVTGALLVPRASFNAAGFFNDRLRHADSTEWFLRVHERGGRGAVVPRILLHRRLHEHNVSRLARQESYDEFTVLLKEKLDRARQRSAG